MKILTRLINLLSVSTKEDDTLTIYTVNLKVVYKHNDVGVSVDYYQRGQNTPFREDQIWFNDQLIQQNFKK